MNLRQLRTLIAVAEHGNLAKAAEAIALTPSAVSQQMTTLEDEVGVALFDRTTRPPTLTYQGQQLLDAAMVINQTAENALSAIRGKNMAGAFSIGAVRSSAFGSLPKAIAQLKQEYPMLKINLRMGKTDDLIFDVGAGRLDAAIVAEPQVLPPKLIFTSYIEDPLLVITQPSPVSTDPIELLATQEYIHFFSNVPLARQIDSELRKRNITIKSTIRIDSIFGIIQCVINGLGVSVVPHTSITQPFPVNVCSLPFGDPPIIRRIGIVQVEPSPKSLLIDTLHDKLAQLSSPYGKFRHNSNIK